MSEIMAQVIGQAGPALKLARDTLGVGSNGGERKAPAEENGHPGA
jgi:hypothetical protein